MNVASANLIQHPIFTSFMLGMQNLVSTFPSDIYQQVATIKIVFVVASAMLLSWTLHGQDDSKRYSVMAIPYVKEGQDIRTVLEENETLRLALTSIKSFLNSQGYTTLDFKGKLQKAKQNQLFKGLDNRNTIKDKFVEFAGPDIYVEVEAIYQPGNNGNRIRLLLNTYHTVTSISMSSLVCQSSPFYTNDIGGLTLRALKECNSELEASFQAGFNQLRINGQPIQLHFIVSDEVDLTTNSIFEDPDIYKGKAALSDLIEYWISESTIINYYRLKGKTDKQIIFDELRIVFNDENGNYISPNKLLLQLKRYLRNLHIPEQADKSLMIQDDRIGNTWFLRISME